MKKFQETIQVIPQQLDEWQIDLLIQALGGFMTKGMCLYYVGRERVEREAAERASSAKVRRIHLELAERYGRLARPHFKPVLGF